MEWLSILLFAACPLMMLFCLRGIFSGNKKETHQSQNSSASAETHGIEGLQVQMRDLTEQNQQLMREVENLKRTKRVNPASDIQGKATEKEGIS